MDANIQKIKKVVELGFIRDKEIVIEQFYIFLNRFSAIHKGEESVQEFLEDEKNFIPAINIESNEFALINKSDIISLIIPDDIEDADEGPIKIHFSDGLYLKVALPELILPTFRSRPVDYFNSCRSFIELSYYEKQIFININKIEKVTGV